MSYTPLSKEGWSLIANFSPSGFNIDIPLTGSFAMYVLHITDLKPTLVGQDLWLRVSTDGGTSFKAVSGDYSWHSDGASTTAVYNTVEALASEIVLTEKFVGGMGIGATQSLNGWVYIYNAKQTAHAVCVSADIVMLDATAIMKGHRVSGALVAASNTLEVDAVRLLTSGGITLASGMVTLYGVDTL